MSVQTVICQISPYINFLGGVYRQQCMGRVQDSGVRGPVFHFYLRCVVSLSKMV